MTPFPAASRRADALLAFVLHARAHLVPGQRAESEDGCEQPAEVHERPRGYGAALGVGLSRKRRAQLGLRHAPMADVDDEEQHAERSAEPARERVRQDAHERAHRERRAGTRRDDGTRAPAAAHRRRPAARRTSSAALRQRAHQPLVERLGTSSAIASGTAAAANGSGRSGSSRTASFSVVSTSDAPVSRTAAAMRARSAATVAMVVAELQQARHLPAVRFERALEALGRRDAGQRDDRRICAARRGRRLRRRSARARQAIAVS